MPGKFVIVLFCMAVLWPGGNSYADENTFYSPTHGFSVTKPDGWIFASASEIIAAKSGMTVDDKELEKLMRERIALNVPLVAITKYPEPVDRLNPSVQVMFKAIPPEMIDMDATDFLEMMVPTLKRAFLDFEITEGVDNTLLGGRDAAYFRTTYTVRNQAGDEFPVISRMWVVPRDGFFFLISMSGTKEGEDVSEEEFNAIARSIRLDD